MVVVGTFLPVETHAASFEDVLVKTKGGVLSQWLGGFSGTKSSVTWKMSSDAPSVQTMSLPKAAMNIDPNPAKGGGDIIIADDSALVPEEGPSGAGADIVRPKNAMISVYVVREGDTLSSIAEMFDVSVNTIMWANDLKRGAPIKLGQTLTVLPVTGVRYVVKKGDTVASIAKAFHADQSEILSFNGIDGETLAAGDQIIIPDGEVAAPAPSAAPQKKPVVYANTSSGTYAGYYMRPVAGAKRTQGVHGYNGVDLAAPRGTPIMAAAVGEVIISREGGWNGGYGNYIVIRHPNGTQTLYAHNLNNVVGIGQQVVQGQVIGYVGSTGRSTGPHVHFEIRGGPRNPF